MPKKGKAPWASCKIFSLIINREEELACGYK